MKKFIFTLMLAAAGGAWSEMQAICMASFRPKTGETEYFSGQLIWVGMPCEGGEDVPCQTCLTVALQTASDHTTYYLTGLDQETQYWIESVEDSEYWSITVAGVRFTSGSYEYIQVDRIWKRCMSDISMCDDKMNVTICGTLRPYVLTGDEDHFFDTPAGSETVVLESADGTYFLHWDSKEDLQILLDTLQAPLSVMVSGQWDCYDHLVCIIVHGITIGDCRPVRIMCDEWNVLMTYDMGPDEVKYETVRYSLGTDTVIGDKLYQQLLRGGDYDGAIREGDNRNIFIVPRGSTHEYLLYEFNVNDLGKNVSNLWIGGQADWSPNGYEATVKIVKGKSVNNRRYYDVSVKVADGVTLTAHWLEGIGSLDGPSGSRCPAIVCEGDMGQALLCAYKDGEQVYASEEAERFGCWYDSNEQQADTVKMYVQDGPGSSTVDPVDPNQIVVIVKDGQLIIREYLDVDLTFTLERIGALHAPARNDATQSDTFHESVAIPLTESGVYQLTLTHPDWGYSIVGTFEYTITGMPATVAQTVAQKIIRDGRLLIRQGGKTFTLTGVEVK